VVDALFEVFLVTGIDFNERPKSLQNSINRGRRIVFRLLRTGNAIRREKIEMIRDIEMALSKIASRNVKQSFSVCNCSAQGGFPPVPVNHFIGYYRDHADLQPVAPLPSPARKNRLAK